MWKSLLFRRKDARHSCDILYLSSTSRGRAMDIVEPVLSYLEIKHGLSVVREETCDYQYKILKFWPRLLIRPTSAGSLTDYKVVRFASKVGIKVVTFVTEGLIDEEAQRIDSIFWGLNDERKIFEDLQLKWSKSFLEKINFHYPTTRKHNIKVSGGTGFDKYRLFSFLSKDQFLKKKNMASFKRVIGIASWGFDVFCGRTFYEAGWLVYPDDETIHFFEEERKKLNEIYKKIIEKNKDVCFILKFHPSTHNKLLTEFEGLEKFSNVVVIESSSEDQIDDLINASDIWIAYESTTILEAWLLKKETIVINPSGATFKGFSRLSFYRGTTLLSKYEETQRAIDSFYSKGTIPENMVLEETRRRMIQESIGWDDGLNHVRAAEHIYHLLQNDKHKQILFEYSDLSSFAKYFAKRIILMFPFEHFSEKFKAVKCRCNENKLWFSKEEALKNRTRYREALEKFHGARETQHKAKEISERIREEYLAEREKDLDS